MGIPVWVARERVCFDTTADHSIESPLEASLANPESYQKDATHQHVDELLHDLQSPQAHGKDTVLPQSAAQPDSPASSNPANFVPAKQPPKQETEIARTAFHAVYACGDLNAEWMIIGESPDISSNTQNQPYAGDAGVLLSNMLKAVGIEDPRNQAYLVNILKFPLQTTNSSDTAETGQLRQILLQKIQQVNPGIVLLVGQIAAQNLLNSKEPLARLRGRVHSLPESQVPLVVTYYPSYLLSKPIDKRKAWDDLKLAMQVCRDSKH